MSGEPTAMGTSRCLTLSFLILVCSLFSCSLWESDQKPGPKARPGLWASWVVRTDMTSKEEVHRIVEEAKQAKLDALFVQVRGRGDAYFQGGVEPVAEGGSRDFDPLREFLEATAGTGIQVHAWVNVFLLSGTERVPSDPAHAVRAHPEWLQYPLELAKELLQLPPSHPDFLMKLLAHGKSRAKSVEGLYADPSSMAYREHLVRVVTDISSRYEVAGLHLDYVRYPGKDYGYSVGALDRFRVEVDREITAAERSDMASRVRTDPLVYTRRYPIRWAETRRRAVTETVEALAGAARRARPGIEVSTAVIADITRARDELFQEWTRWLEQGIVQACCPMNYAGPTENSMFLDRCRAAVAAKRGGRIYMGIGAYLLPLSTTVMRAESALGEGADGVLFFSHASLKKERDGFARIGAASTTKPTAAREKADASIR